MAFLENNQQGTTLIELLVVIAIIGIMTSIFVVQIRLSASETLHQATEQTASDLKQLRNLTISRVINENNTFPVGGYGVFFNDAVSPSYYVIYADNGHAGFQDYSCQVVSCPAACNNYCDSDPNTFVPDATIKKYIYDSDITIYPTNVGFPGSTFFYNFTSEHTATTSYSGGESLGVTIENTADGSTSEVDVLDYSADGYIWGNIRAVYN